MNAHELPLKGLKVVDLTHLLPGPYGTQLLGDMGAEIVKVEEPRTGDQMREQEPKLPDGTSQIFASLNRNKQSIAVDLKTDQGREILLDLITTSDIMVEQFRPGVADRLGIGYEDAKPHNDNLVYCSLSGYGQSGPYRQWPGHDINYIGIGGLLGVTESGDDPPSIPGIPVADYAGGLGMAFAALVGVVRSKISGKGLYLDVSMTDIVTSWMSLYLPRIPGNESEDIKCGSSIAAGDFPCYSVYECADGNYITLGAMEEKFWIEFCEQMGLEQYANPKNHYAHGELREKVRSSIEEAFRARPLADWIERLDPTEIPIAPVNDLKDIATDPQVMHRDLLTPLETPWGSVHVFDIPISTTPSFDTIRSSYPGLGEHSFKILRDLGYSEDEIHEFDTAGITTIPSAEDAH